MEKKLPLPAKAFVFFAVFNLGTVALYAVLDLPGWMSAVCLCVMSGCAGWNLASAVWTRKYNALLKAEPKQLPAKTETRVERYEPGGWAQS